MFTGISTIVKEILFEKWYNDNIEELRIQWAESGADREMDFDEDREIERQYELFMNHRFMDTL